MTMKKIASFLLSLSILTGIVGQANAADVSGRLITSARGGMMQISGAARGRTPVPVRLFEAA